MIAGSLATKRKLAQAVPAETPKRPNRRALALQISEEKEPSGVKRLQRGARQDVTIKEEPKRAPDAVEVAAEKPTAVLKQYAPGSRPEEAVYSALLDQRGVPLGPREMLLNQMRRWGTARAGQVLDLYESLGDGQSRGISYHELQVWGPPGVGKTAVLDGFLAATGLRHIEVDPGCFVSFGEFLARMTEELRRCVVDTIPGCDPELLQPLAHRQIRVMDRMEAALKPILEQLNQAKEADGKENKVIIVIDNAQDLPSLHPKALEDLLKLDQTLQLPFLDHLVFVFVSQLPLRQLGVACAPKAISFQAYERKEAETILVNALQTKLEQGNSLVELIPSEQELRTVAINGAMEFATANLGHLEDLVQIGEGLLMKPEIIKGNVATLQEEVLHLVHRRHCLPSLAKLLCDKEVSVSPEADAILLSMRSLTKVQKRLLLAAYLGSHIDPSEDVQLFLPGGRGRRYRKKKQQDKKKVAKASQEESPFLKEAQPVLLPRLLSIYQRIANCSQQLLGPSLLERLKTLQDLALIRFEKQVNMDRDRKVICCAELPLARACAEELNVDLAEFLCSW